MNLTNASRIIGAAITALIVAGCSSNPATTQNTNQQAERPSIVVLSHESFDFPQELLDQFATESGIDVTIEQVGDGGELANKLVLTKDSPLGDVVYGLDNTVSSRLAGKGVIAEVGIDSPNAELNFAGEAGLIPIDQGDVCINVDKTWFADHNLAIPQTFEDLTKDDYRDLLVAMNPTSSTPGMAFMLATIAHFGEDGWQNYWQQLRDNGMKVTQGWSDAFSVDYSAGEGAGPYPLMVSYGSSPAYSVTDDGSESTTAALLATCYRQVEYAGVIAGSANEDAAKQFVEFMLSVPVQEAISEVTYMHPTNPEAKAPADLEQFGPLAPTITTLPADKIAANAETWLRQWQATVVD